MRSHLAERGFAFNLDYTEFAQGLLSQKDPNGWGEAGRADLLINLDTEKLGLWTGGGIVTMRHLPTGSYPTIPRRPATRGRAGSYKAISCG
ncbi:MAG: hypothetical protein KGS60_00950 [Verrucomicrobia bacterium]|nr:hypothetical protein [Verrucomicrobiota bacterium]